MECRMFRKQADKRKTQILNMILWRFDKNLLIQKFFLPKRELLKDGASIIVACKVNLSNAPICIVVWQEASRLPKTRSLWSFLRITIGYFDINVRAKSHIISLEPSDNIWKSLMLKRHTWRALASLGSISILKSAVFVYRLTFKSTCILCKLCFCYFWIILLPPNILYSFLTLFSQHYSLFTIWIFNPSPLNVTFTAFIVLCNSIAKYF